MTTNPSPRTPRPASRTTIRRRGTSNYLRGIPAATWLAAMGPGRHLPDDRSPAA
jgi:hypothetical protein